MNNWYVMNVPNILAVKEEKKPKEKEERRRKQGEKVKERRKQEKESKEKKEPENNFLNVVYKMFNFLYYLFWGVEEKNSLCPNSFSTMPGNKFHNFAIIRGEPDDD